MRRIRLDGRDGRANSDQTKTRWSPSGLAVRDRHSQDRPGPSLPDGMGIGDDKLMEMVAGLERRLGGESRRASGWTRADRRCRGAGSAQPGPR